MASGSLNKDVVLTIKANDIASKDLLKISNSVEKLEQVSTKTGLSFSAVERNIQSLSKVLDDTVIAETKLTQQSKSLLTASEDISNRLPAEVSRYQELESQLAKLKAQVAAVKSEAHDMSDGFHKNEAMANVKALTEQMTALGRETTAARNVKLIDETNLKSAQESIARIETQIETLSNLQTRAASAKKGSELFADSLSVAEAHTAAMQAQETQLTKLKAALHPVAAQLDLLAKEESQVSEWFEKGKLSASDYETAISRLDEQLTNLDKTSRGGIESRAEYIARLQEEERVTKELTVAQEQAERYQTSINQQLGVTAAPTSLEHNSRQNALQSAFRTDSDGTVSNQSKQKAQLQSLLDTISPTEAAARKLGEQLDTLDNAFNHGWISTEKYLESVRSLQNGLTDTDAVMMKDAAEVKQLLAELDPLDSATRKLATDQARWHELVEKGLLTQDQYSKAVLGSEQALERLAVRTRNAPTLTMFGLQGYETQNLMYQINDVVTGLASGQPVMQVIAQQAGQIFQLFQNRLLPVMKEFISSLAGKTAVAGLVALGLELHHVFTELSEIRDLQSSMALSADGGLYDADTLAKSVTQLKYYGASAEEALKSVKALQSASIDQKLIPDVSLVSWQLANATGKKLSDTTGEVVKAFDGSVTSILKLNDQYHFLSASQRTSIKDAIESGDSVKGLNEAMDALREKTANASDVMNHGLAPAFHRLLVSMGELSDKLGGTGIFAGWIEDIGAATRSLSLFLDKLNGVKDSRNIKLQMDAVDHEISKREYYRDHPVAGIVRSTGEFFAGSADGLMQDSKGLGDPTQLDKEIAELKKQKDDLAKKLTAASGGTPLVDPKSNRAKISADSEADAESDAATAKFGSAPAPMENRDKFTRRYVTNGVENYLGDGVKGGTLTSKYPNMTAEDISKFTKAITEQLTREAGTLYEKAERSEQTNFINRVGKAEGYGPNQMGSSASGYGQFMPQTWTTFFKRMSPNSGLDDKQILAKRDDSTVAKGVLAEAVKEYSDQLKKAGLVVNAASLYAMHFLGSDAIPVLKNPDTPMNQVNGANGKPLRSSIFSQNYKYTHGDDGRVLTGNEMMRDRLAPKMRAESDDDPIVSAQQSLYNQQKEAEQRNKQFSTELDGQIEKYQQIISDIKDETDLTAEGLLNRKKTLAVLNEEHSIRQKIADSNASRKNGEPLLRVSDAKIKQAASLAGDAYQAQNAPAYAKAARSQYDLPVSTLEKQRTEITQLIEAYSKLGQGQEVSELDIQLTGVNHKLREASETALEFYENIKKTGTAAAHGLTGDELDSTIDKLKITKEAGSEVGKEFLVTGRQINEDLAGGMSSSMGSFLTGLAQGKGLIKSLQSSFGEFFSSFLMQIGEAILKQTLFNSLAARSGTQGAAGAGGLGGMIAGKIVGLFGSAFGGGGSAVASSAGSSASMGLGGSTSTVLSAFGLHHSGGLIGQASGASKLVNLSAFTHAPKFHDGGVISSTNAPLTSDEVPMVGKVGEEVLTANDPRHINNVNKRSAAQSQDSANGIIKNVLVQDPSQLAKALSGSHGAKVVLTHIAQNAQETRAALGIS